MHSMFMIKKIKQTIHALNTCHEEDITLLGKDKFLSFKEVIFIFLFFFPYIALAFI